MCIYLSIQFFVKQGFFVGRAFLGELLLRGVAVCGGKVTEVGGKYANTSVDWVGFQWRRKKDYGSSGHSCQHFRKLRQASMAPGEKIRK